MTQAQMIELIQQHHPVMGETLARINLNRAKDDFCSETGILRENSVIASVAGQRYYALDAYDRMIRVSDIHINNVIIPRLVGLPIIDDEEHSSSGLGAPTTSSNDRYWFIDSNRLGIVEKGSVTQDDKSSNYQSISVTGLDIRRFGMVKDWDFDSDGTGQGGSSIGMTESPNFPQQFHEALIYKTIAEGYSMGGSQPFQPEAAQYFDVKYAAIIKKARKFDRSGRINSTRIINPTSF